MLDRLLRLFRPTPRFAAHEVDAWLEDALAFYRPLGFLADGRDAAALKAAAQIPFDPTDRLADLALLTLDHDRVHWEDTEADVCMGNEAYVEYLTALARISRGRFQPVDLVETWAGEAGPITVSFTLDGAPQTLRPKYVDDWLDMAILPRLNAMGMSFALVAAFDQTAFVVDLTPAERVAITRARGIRFV